MAEHDPLLSESEVDEAEKRSPPTAKVVHAAILKQGEDELERPLGSLFWSGTAAGFAIFASLWAQAGLHHHLPDAPWRDAVTSLGYTLGFLMVILGRMQLFTEQTMVAVMPVAMHPSGAMIGRTARLWAAVLAGNLVGTAAMAALAAFGDLQSDALRTAMVEVSSKLQERSALATMLHAIPAGFLIATIAWIRSAADDNSFWIVLVITYTIALGAFAHVVAGAAEAFFLLWTGEASPGWVAGGFLLPALVGNIIGGTGLFAMLAHAQVKEEV